jgi:hypothetical protein
MAKDKTKKASVDTPVTGMRENLNTFTGGSSWTEGDALVIRIEDINANHGPSASGKTLIVASTQGNKPLARSDENKDVIVGLNVYVRR